MWPTPMMQLFQQMVNARGTNGVCSWNFILLGCELWPGYRFLFLFLRKYKIETFRLPRLGGRKLSLSSEVKYLGVVMHNKLNQKRSTEERMKKALNALYQCRNSTGKSWGLSPKAIRWIYLAIVRPVISYGRVVWWSGLNKNLQWKILNKVQR